MVVDGEQKNRLDFKAIAESLYKDNYQYIYKVVVLMVRDKAVAEDLVQEAFYKAFKKIDQLRDGNKSKAWLTAIAINLCKSYMNQKKKELPLEDFSAHPSEGSVEKQFLHHLTIREIEDIFDQLDFKEKEIILLKYYFGFSSKEIADYYKISVENVNVKLFRAKNKFKEKHRRAGKGA